MSPKSGRVRYVVVFFDKKEAWVCLPRFAETSKQRKCKQERTLRVRRLSAWRGILTRPGIKKHRPARMPGGDFRWKVGRARRGAWGQRPARESVSPVSKEGVSGVSGSMSKSSQEKSSQPSESSDCLARFS